MSAILTLNGNILTNNGNALIAPDSNWMGKNPEFIKRVYSLDTTLDQTKYATWKPSSTATSIKASTTLSTKEIMNLEDYDYILYWVSDCQVAYDDTWTASAASCLREMCVYTQAVFRRPSTIATIESSTFNYNATQADVYNCYWCVYHSSATAISVAYTSYSPCYISAITAPTFSSTSASTPTVTIKTPVLSARCSKTYFSTANAEKVDQENSTVKMDGYLYRVEAGTSSARNMWKILTDTYNNPL